jgi:predicted nucleotidyltransferase
MMSHTGATGKYIMQPALLKKHTTTLEWLSTSIQWKSELLTFQKMLDERSPLLSSVEEIKKLSAFQNLIIYYQGEVVHDLRKKLRALETRVSNMLESRNELHMQYYKEHDEIIDQLQNFSVVFNLFRNELFEFMQAA